MKNERAIQILDSANCGDYKDTDLMREARQKGIEALRKQIPTRTGTTKTGAPICPCCNRFLDRHEQKHGNIDIPYCKWCGQAIKW